MVGQGLAVCIIGQTRSLNRPEVWQSLRDNVLRPATAELGSSDVFMCVKSDIEEGGSRSASPLHSRMKRRLFRVSERRATNATAAELHAVRLTYLSSNYTDLFGSAAKCSPKDRCLIAEDRCSFIARSASCAAS